MYDIKNFPQQFDPLQFNLYVVMYSRKKYKSRYVEEVSLFLWRSRDNSEYNDLQYLEKVDLYSYFK